MGGAEPRGTARRRCRDGSAGASGAADRRERNAQDVVVSRTTSPDDLASLLAMLDLRPERD
ncbi:hypothetical protein [Streptomyces sp. G-G2]|uniref:hypothetical protein n=1 Tax=Streptomyces sp. G-G2 TaxID=3046201 RepID=UPI0024B8E222|nr:hypothetical protein [Streptomyces sp. G-G2]MDJ0382373.1 hypothetical protein [Streptomyces sp. G-G2]